MDSCPVVVIGAGMGGLAAALDLARTGHAVTVVESASTPGGKVRETELDGAPIDCGATVLTMKWVFEELFADAGARFDERLGTSRAEILARHAWSERERLDLFADPARSADAIGDFAGAASARGFESFCKRARDVYDVLLGSFIRAQRPTLLGLVQRAGAARLLRVRPYETLWRELGTFFSDPRLRQLFARYATYCGSSPLRAPATLMLVAHVELEGVWTVTGGMPRLPEAVADLAAERGAHFRYRQTVREIVLERGRVAGVLLESGERLAAAAVVVNADSGALPAGLLGARVRGAAPQVAPEDRSFSAVTLAMRARTDGFPLARHNVFFGPSSEIEFAELSERLPSEPSVYLHAQDAERLFLILNAPAKPLAQAEIERCIRSGMERMARCGLAIQISSAVRATPSDFEHRFPGSGGAIYGRATHGPMASFQRPAARTRIPGLYLAGGSVHPGPGVPMATLSGRLAAASLIEDFRSTARSRLVVISGGTSMH